MDSISLTTTITKSVRIAVANGTLNSTTFSQTKEDSAGYGAVGTATGTIDRFYWKEHIVAPSGSVTINLASLPEAPEGASAGAVVTLTELHVKISENANSTITASGLRIGDATGVNMAKMMFGSVSTTFDVPKSPGLFSWAGDGGVAVGGNSIKFTNLDSSNTITFTVEIAGRST
jgi:hypothetical protein